MLPYLIAECVFVRVEDFVHQPMVFISDHVESLQVYDQIGSTFGLDCLRRLWGPHLPLCLVDTPQLFERVLNLQCRLAGGMLPRLDFLLVMELGVGLHAVGAERLQAVDAHAEIGELFTGVLEALQTGTITPLHEPITDKLTNKTQSNLPSG